MNDLFKVGATAFQAALRDIRRSGKLSPETNRSLESFSKAVSKAYPPKRILRDMHHAYNRGQTVAALDAMFYCADNEIALPSWAVKGWAAYERAEKKSNGRPEREAWINLFRVWAVLRCAKQQRYGRSKQGDKYHRAAHLLANTNPKVFAGLPVAAGADAIKKSYLTFQRTHSLGYLSYYGFLTPALREMFLNPAIERLGKTGKQLA